MNSNKSLATSIRLKVIGVVELASSERRSSREAVSRSTSTIGFDVYLWNFLVIENGRG